MEVNLSSGVKNFLCVIFYSNFLYGLLRYNTGIQQNLFCMFAGSISIRHVTDSLVTTKLLFLNRINDASHGFRAFHFSDENLFERRYAI